MAEPTSRESRWMDAASRTCLFCATHQTERATSILFCSDWFILPIVRPVIKEQCSLKKRNLRPTRLYFLSVSFDIPNKLHLRECFGAMFGMLLFEYTFTPLVLCVAYKTKTVLRSILLAEKIPLIPLPIATITHFLRHPRTRRYSKTSVSIHLVPRSKSKSKGKPTERGL